MASVLQPWVMDLGLCHQGILISACRDCDTAPKHVPSELAHCLLRGAILEPHAGRRLIDPVPYILVEPDEARWHSAMHDFVVSSDHYPHRYVALFRHAVEIIGYHGPHQPPVFGARWLHLYRTICELEHVEPESKEQLDARLEADQTAFRGT